MPSTSQLLNLPSKNVHHYHIMISEFWCLCFWMAAPGLGPLAIGYRIILFMLLNNILLLFLLRGPRHLKWYPSTGSFFTTAMYDVNSTSLQTFRCLEISCVTYWIFSWHRTLHVVNKIAALWNMKPLWCVHYMKIFVYYYASTWEFVIRKNW